MGSKRKKKRILKIEDVDKRVEIKDPDMIKEVEKALVNILGLPFKIGYRLGKMTIKLNDE